MFRMINSHLISMLNKFLMFGAGLWTISEKNKHFFQNEKGNRKYSSLGFLLHTFDKPWIYWQLAPVAIRQKKRYVKRSADTRCFLMAMLTFFLGQNAEIKTCGRFFKLGKVKSAYWCLQCLRFCRSLILSLSLYLCLCLSLYPCLSLPLSLYLCVCL